MAPQNKRAAPSPKKGQAGAGKKAKVQAVDESLPLALRQRLEPVFGALGGCQNLPEPCREMLRLALPYCVAETGEERHDYQLQIFTLVVGAFDQVETSKREAVEAAEQKVATLTTDLENAKAELSSADAEATAQKAASDGQGTKVQEKDAAVQAAKVVVEEAKQAVQDFHAKKAQTESNLQSFIKVIEDLWKPLLEGNFPGQQWRKRDKMVIEFVKSLEPVQMEGSLVDAITVALKTRTEQRGTFANLAIGKADEKLIAHKERLAEEVAGMDSEEEACKQNVISAESALEAAIEDKKKEDEEHINLQNIWVSADEKAFGARGSVETFTQELLATSAEAASLKQALEAFQVVQSQLQALNEEIPVTTAPAAVPEPAAQQAEGVEEAEMAPAAVEAPPAVAAC